MCIIHNLCINIPTWILILIINCKCPINGYPFIVYMPLHFQHFSQYYQALIIHRCYFHLPLYYNSLLHHSMLMFLVQQYVSMQYMLYHHRLDIAFLNHNLDHLIFHSKYRQLPEMLCTKYKIILNIIIPDVFHPILYNHHKMAHQQLVLLSLIRIHHYDLLDYLLSFFTCFLYRNIINF